ncbi:hypothetical protein M0R45_027505 [Rubus argutus]|uniref:Uncharacterized protein n=1 Tax=Rubus argutus TaxID=59490 RepID=A0AAW1X2B5_RUBAR
MASSSASKHLLSFILLLSLFCFSSAARSLAETSDQTQQPILFQYHNGPLLTGKISINLICKCGTHGSSKSSFIRGKSSKFAYIWVGNSETQCPGQCAWPFHQPIYGPQSPPLVAPNNDVGLDGMIINLASLLAGTVTNPFGNGFYQGPKEAPLEAASACPGVYAKGAYPGYAGDLLVDATTGASYNANGLNGKKYLLPALFDPSSSTCSTLV